MDPGTEDGAKPTSNRVTWKEEIRPLDYGEWSRMVKLGARSLSPSAIIRVVIPLRRARRKFPWFLQVLKTLNRLSKKKWSVG